MRTCIGSGQWITVPYYVWNEEKGHHQWTWKLLLLLPPSILRQWTLNSHSSLQWSHTSRHLSVCVCVKEYFVLLFFFLLYQKIPFFAYEKTSHKMHSDASLFTQSAFGNGPWNSEPIFHSLRLKCLVNLFLLELLCRWRRTEENEKIKNIFFFFAHFVVATILYFLHLACYFFASDACVARFVLR